MSDIIQNIILLIIKFISFSCDLHKVAAYVKCKIHKIMQIYVKL